MGARVLTVSSGREDSSSGAAGHGFAKSFNQIDREFQEQMLELDGVKAEEVVEVEDVAHATCLPANN